MVYYSHGIECLYSIYLAFIALPQPLLPYDSSYCLIVAYHCLVTAYATYFGCHLLITHPIALVDHNLISANIMTSIVLFIDCYYLVMAFIVCAGCYTPTLVDYHSMHGIIILLIDHYYRWSFFWILWLLHCGVGFLLPLCIQELGISIAVLYCGTRLFISNLYEWNVVILLPSVLWISSFLCGLFCKSYGFAIAYYIIFPHLSSLCRALIQAVSCPIHLTICQLLPLTCSLLHVSGYLPGHP